DEGEAGINLPGFKNAYSVAVDPLGRVWFGSMYERRLADATLPELERYPDLRYEITERDTGTGAYLDTAKIWGSPVFVWDPTDGSIDTIRYMEFSDGTQDTLVYGRTHRGMARSYDGNMIVATTNEVYKVNYQTYEAMTVWTAPDGATPLQSLATDDNGYVYTQSLWGGDLFVLDPDDLSLYTTVTDAAPFTRGGGVSSDGTEVFVGLTGGGAQRYYSEWGPDGTYVLEDTVGLPVLTTGMSLWDPAGYLWNIACVDQDDKMWSFDAANEYVVDDSTSFSYGTSADTTIYGYTLPEIVRCPRDAAFNAAGDKMYLADFYGYTIKEFYCPDCDHPSNVEMTVGLAEGFSGDTLLIPFELTLPMDSSISSLEISVDYDTNRIQLLDLETADCLTGVAGWNIQHNLADNALLISGAGSEDITGTGILFWLEFVISDSDLAGFVPIMITSVQFNENNWLINLHQGGINVLAQILGDVSLDGAVHAYDASLILKYLVGYIDLSEHQLINANVSMDTTVSALDATIILQYIVNLIDSLPPPVTADYYATGLINMFDSAISSGAAIAIPFHLSGGSNILAIESEFSYNPDHLVFNDISWVALNQDFMIETKADSGIIKSSAAGSLPDGQSGLMGFLEFTVKDDFNESQTIISLSSLRWNEEIQQADVCSSVLTNILYVPDDGNNIPVKFALHENYPNPFNPTTVMRYDIPAQTHITLTIFDLLGRQIAVPVNREVEPGYYSVSWNGRDNKGKLVAAGMYLYTIRAENFVQTRKMILLK
ncbi:MAG: T9SS type A sorting domain-containing protein, partial [Candidatus Marinimicrobia bacterium]|nr:T9SS type A sorting domain-containing protein [Candidatus Neomarinimicrobiota bacterium]